MNVVGLIIMMAIIIAPIIVYAVKYSTSKMKLNNCREIDRNASIVNITSVRDTWGKKVHIKTTVVFSDGSEYYTYKCRKEPGFAYFRIIVDRDVIEEIKEDAIKAHMKLFDEKNT